MYITPNYVCYVSITGSQQINFRNVTAVFKERGLLFNNQILIKTTAGDFQFAGFIHRDEVHAIIEYLWKFPPVLDSSEPKKPSSPPPPPPVEPSKGFSGGSASRGSGGESSSGGGYGSGERSVVSSGASVSGYGGGKEERSFSSPFDDEVGFQVGGQKQTQKVKVDTEASKNALKVALQIREMGTETLVKLQEQGEQIDKIEHSLENINNRLDKTDRLLVSLESLPGAIYNALTEDKTKGPTAFVPGDRPLGFKPRLPPVDIQILLKHANDNLTAAVLRAGPEVFSCMESESLKPYRDMTWDYVVIDKIVIRSRPLHIDVRFQKNLPRFRFMTSFPMQAVNELYMRSEIPPAAVIFEPSPVPPFPFGHPLLSKINIVSRNEAAENASWRANRQNKKTSDVLAGMISEETARDLDKQDEDLEQIGFALNDIHGIAKTMGGELDRQNEQLGRVETKLDSTNVRVKVSNRRIDHIS
eukprot:TRINITY_DN2212_c0_g1_i1.p1 TRINITY_DN2212_c0_g1~~TRINITY_DN2212_c0_g1_i1.p1  ORF type:complete len:473 (+),score=122.95 TRINITY_DN2212_c0_g1_i1:216-1634(+)